jgi:hypothetical protein
VVVQLLNARIAVIAMDRPGGTVHLA